MIEQPDRFAVPREHILLKPIWEFLSNPHPGNASENALNGGIRFVDRYKQTEMNTVLMQAAESGHVVHAGDITMGRERIMCHLPAFNGAAALVIGIMTMELNGHTVQERDILSKGRIIEQPVPSDDINVDPPEQPVLMPYYMKPPIEDLLKEGRPVSEIDELIAGRIMTLRPFTLSKDYEVPEKLRAAVNKGIVSTTPIYVQNFMSVYSHMDRKNEAIELVDIVNGRKHMSAEEGAKRIGQILRLDM